jgi:tRNA A37 threonylcarbamoyladenosine modification protein TsaB
MAKSVSFWPGVVVPVIDAKKACYYTALYEQGKRNTEYLDIGLEYLLPLAPLAKPMLFTGPDAESVAGILAAKYPGGSIHCDPRGARGYAMELLECAMIRFKESGLGESDSLGPLYLRKSDAEMVQEARSRADRG